MQIDIFQGAEGMKAQVVLSADEVEALMANGTIRADVWDDIPTLVVDGWPVEGATAALQPRNLVSVEVIRG